MADSLPSDIVQAIAINNAKSISDQPSVLSNLALANQVLNNNMQQQLMINQQQAMNQITMATLSKCVAVITNADASDPKSLADYLDVLKGLNTGASQMTQNMSNLKQAEAEVDEQKEEVKKKAAAINKIYKKSKKLMTPPAKPKSIDPSKNHKD
jgi:hypothetical protein